GGLKTIYVAPYINTTHACMYHSPSCQGELVNISFDYLLFDNEGTLLDNITLISEANGFFSVDLPVDRAYMMLIGSFINGTQYVGSALITTYSDSPDCLTTTHLMKI
ncbi:MAG: CueP family metal-binding protein, partial [Candidatus Thorarchaeota archaeon]